MSSQPKQYPFSILSRRAVWFAVSAVVILSGLVKMAINNQTTGQSLSFGIDFNGGAAYVYKLAQRPGNSSAEVIGKVRDVLLAAGIQRPKIQEFADGEIQVRTLTGADVESVPTAADDAKAEAEKILTELRGKFGTVELVQTELVGPVIGEHLRKQGSVALVIGCLLILIYITARYNISAVGGGAVFGACAVLALVHDALVMLAVYAWTMSEVNTSFVAALLTVVGYSVNDTVIIYDRIRENLRLLDAPQRRNMAVIEQTMEDSLWQTMTRSVLTLGTTMFPLLTLYLFGGVTIRDFAFALLVGIISGGYSSVFMAAPCVLVLLKRQAAKAQETAVRSGPARRPGPARPKPVTTPVEEPVRETPKPVPSAKPTAGPAGESAEVTREGGTTKSSRSRRRGKRRRY